MSLQFPGKFFRAVILTSFLFCLTAVNEASGQHNPYEFFSGGETEDGEVFRYPATDMRLFYTPEYFPDDIFTAMSEFNFSHIKYSRRGYARSFDKVFFGNVSISDKLVSHPDLSLYYNLRRVKFPREVFAGEGSGGGYPGSPGETKIISPDISILAQAHTVSAFASDRKARWGGRLSSSGVIKTDKWYYTADVYRRWGRDADVDGVFTDETSFLAGLQCNLSGTHALSFIVSGSKNENGLRSSATREAFDLTGDKYYNPSWGYFDGKMRNSRVGERFQPVFIIHYSGLLSKNTSLSATLLHRTGENSYTALSWFDAATPYPDYYRYMPSYEMNPETSELLAGKWKSKDASVSQINWEEMHRVNKMNDGRAVYTLEDRVEKANDFQAGVTFSTIAGKNVTVDYGLRLRRDRTHFFKRMKDLMGGLPVEDTDQYLYGDEVFGDKTANNTREPDRKINEGDTFGYDYYMTGGRGEAFAAVCYTNYHFRVSAGFAMARNILRRDGKYEKELYPGNLSFGKSGKLDFETYTANLTAAYTITPKHRVSVSGITMSLPPDYGNVFLAPDYSNKTTAAPETYRLRSAQLSYGMTSGVFTVNASGYFTKTSGETAIYNYYDDISSVYSDMVLSEISKKYHGFEIGLRAVVSPRFTVSAAVASGKYEYAGDPDVTIYEEADFNPYVDGSKTYLKGFKLGTSPESVASVEIAYNSGGWMASATYSRVGGRYVTPNPARRMPRAYNLAASPERFSEFVRQEKLPGAGTTGIFVMRTFSFGGTRASVLLSVDNILNEKNTIYNGYEQMRIMKRGTDVNRTYVPFPTKYTYAYGRNYYVSLICRF